MDKKYVSIDVEASGPTPGKYSMLSLGACVVGETQRRFYIELKPISALYIREAMIVGCKGLTCLRPLAGQEIYDPTSSHFRPDLVLDVLAKEGVVPDKGMKEFNDWIQISTMGFRPVMLARPIVFDGAFVNWYFNNYFDGENPFGHSGEDLNSLYQGWRGDLNASVAELLPPQGLTHNALEDAVQQALAAEKVLGWIRKERGLAWLRQLMTRR